MNRKLTITVCLAAVLFTVGLFDNALMSHAYGGWKVTVTNNWGEQVRIVPYYRCTAFESCEWGMKEFPTTGWLEYRKTETYTAPGAYCVAAVKATYCFRGGCVDRWTGCLRKGLDDLQACCWNGNYEIVADKQWGWEIKRK